MLQSYKKSTDIVVAERQLTARLQAAATAHCILDSNVLPDLSRHLLFQQNSR